MAERQFIGLSPTASLALLSALSLKRPTYKVTLKVEMDASRHESAVVAATLHCYTLWGCWSGASWHFMHQVVPILPSSFPMKCFFSSLDSESLQISLQRSNVFSKNGQKRQLRSWGRKQNIIKVSVYSVLFLTTYWWISKQDEIYRHRQREYSKITIFKQCKHVRYQSWCPE